MAHIFYFTADWCNPCKKVRPIVESLQREGIMDFQIIDVDDNHELCKNFQIKSVPTLVFIQNNLEVRRISGAATRDQLLDFINGCS
jgi:thioredoxin 1